MARKAHASRATACVKRGSDGDRHIRRVEPTESAQGHPPVRQWRLAKRQAGSRGHDAGNGWSPGAEQEESLRRAMCDKRPEP